ncbi:MAG: DUF3575 domain-containing protein [Parabacteroides sp.]|nr:DUF3575 domain-containing protein [Parabacteroides sp.]
MTRVLITVALLMTISMTTYSQRVAIKNNLLYDMTATPNLALETKIGEKMTLELYGGYNPFTFGKDDNKRFKHWLVQPEWRYWFCESFNGTFLGVHVHGGEFNVSGLKLPFGMFPTLEDHRYEGYFYGVGVSIGHQWILNKRWSLEAALGLGYARLEYDKYKCTDCSPLLKSSSRNYFGPTRLAVSFVYFLH